MAIVLTVHVVETIWTRRREGGLVAPYLVIDHNGQQQQTEVARAGTTTTAWNQKAMFPYAPTSDLVIMAFDAGRHGGLFLGQAVIGIAAMLQESRLHSITPISSSTGTVVGHIAIEVELATSSKALAASMDIPCLKLSTAGSKISSKIPLAVARQASWAFHDDHLFTYSSPFAVPDVQTGHIQQQAQQQINPMQSASESPTKLSQKLGALGHFLGLSTQNPRLSEAGKSSPANPATPTSVFPASRSSTESSAELAGGTEPRLTRRSMLRPSRSQSSCSEPSAPAMTASITTAHAAALRHSAGMAEDSVGRGATGTASAATGQLEAAVPAVAPSVGHSGYRSESPGSPIPAELWHRRSHASAVKSTASSSRDSESNDALNSRRTAGLTEEVDLTAAASTDGPSSPPPSPPSRTNPAPQLRVSLATPKAAEAPLSPLRSNRLKLRLTPRPAPLSPQEQRLQQQRQLEKDLERLQQLALQERAVHPGLRQIAAVKSQSNAGSDITSSSSTGDDDQLLHDYEAADALGKEAILYRQLIKQQVEQKAGSAQLLKLLAAQQQQEAVPDTQLLATLASTSPGSSPRHHRNPPVPGAQHYPQLPVFTGKQHNDQERIAPALTSRSMHVRSEGDTSSGGSSSYSSNKNKYYPQLPTNGSPATGTGYQLQPAAGRILPRATAAAGTKTIAQHSSQSDVWQSCESGSEAVTPSSAVSNSGYGSQSRQAPTDAARGRTTSRSKHCPVQYSRLQQTVGEVDSNIRGVGSSAVSDAGTNRAWEVGAEGSTPLSGSLDQHPVHEQPAYRCIQSAAGRDKLGYLFVENKAPDAKIAARWCEHSMLDAVPYSGHAEVYPVRALVVEPSAPPQ